MELLVWNVRLHISFALEVQLGEVMGNLLNVTVVNLFGVATMFSRNV